MQKEYKTTTGFIDEGEAGLINIKNNAGECEDKKENENTQTVTYSKKKPENNIQTQQKNFSDETKKTGIIFLILALIACVITLICSICFNIYQHTKIQNITETNTDEVIYWAKNYNKEYTAHQEAVNILSDIKDEYFFYHDHAVIVSSPGGKKYHKYGCYHLGEEFYIYNVENARAQGYTACADCEPDKIQTNGAYLQKRRIDSSIENFPEKLAEPYKK